MCADRRRAGPARRNLLDDLIGTKRLVAGAEHFEHLPAHRGQPLAVLDAERLRVRQRIRGAAAVIVIGCGEDRSHGWDNIRFRYPIPLAQT